MAVPLPLPFRRGGDGAAGCGHGRPVKQGPGGSRRAALPHPPCAFDVALVSKRTRPVAAPQTKAVWREKHMGGMAAQPAAHEKPCLCFGDCAGSLGEAFRARRSSPALPAANGPCARPRSSAVLGVPRAPSAVRRACHGCAFAERLGVECWGVQPPQGPGQPAVADRLSVPRRARSL
jgi:hypothetical protein